MPYRWIAGAADTAIRSTMNVTSATVRQANSRQAPRKMRSVSRCGRLGARAISPGRDSNIPGSTTGAVVSSGTTRSVRRDVLHRGRRLLDDGWRQRNVAERLGVPLSVGQPVLDQVLNR